MMKVAQILVGTAWSGGQNQVFELLTRMEGIEQILITPPGSVLGDKAEKAGIRVFRLAPRGNIDLKYIRTVSDIIGKEKVDLINTHRSKSHTCMLLLKMFFNKKVKLIVTRRVSFGQNMFSRIKYKSRLINGYIAVSEGVKKVLTETGIPAKKIKVIYSGVDTQRFSTAPVLDIKNELGIPPDDQMFCCIANYFGWKGQDILLEAISLGKFIFKNSHFIFAGHRTDERQFLEKAEKLGISGMVRGLGFREDVEKIIAGSNCLIMPSLSGEGFSGAIREALSMGRPVIATRIPGSDELVKDGVTGFLVEPSNAYSLMEGIRKLYNNPILQKEFGKNGRELIMKRFSIERTVADTSEFYKQFI